MQRQGGVKYLVRMSQDNLSTEATPAASITDGRVAGFSLHLTNFDGPFDLLLQLISRHKLDITEVALGAVTDEFISYIKQLENAEQGWDLDKTTEFLVVAATLLDLKAAKLLPSGEVDDEADLALLEARDLLFARLLHIEHLRKSLLYSQSELNGRRNPLRVWWHLNHTLPNCSQRFSLVLGPNVLQRLLTGF